MSLNFLVRKNLTAETNYSWLHGSFNKEGIYSVPLVEDSYSRQLLVYKVGGICRLSGRCLSCFFILLYHKQVVYNL